MLQRGQIFAERYRIEARIAQGGMGVIYAAEHVSTEERVALKVLWPHVLGSKAAVDNFELEARIAARLGSEHIVRILDAGLETSLGLPYLVMELLRGQTLDELVSARGPLAPAEVLWVIRQVAKALDRAHNYIDRRGRPAPIVHRDLKPENLFLSMPEGGPAAVKVLDFGIAKVLSQSQKLSQELRGTPLFMACEQIDGGVLTPRLDVWPIGLIAFYLLTGRYYWMAAARPEAGLSPLFNEILHKPLATASDRVREQGGEPPWPRAFDAWFARCVNRDPDQRFFPAGMAVDALAEALGARDSRPIGAIGALPPPRSSDSAPPAGSTMRLSEAVRATSAWGQTPRGVESAPPPADRSPSGRMRAAADRSPSGRMRAASVGRARAASSGRMRAAPSARMAAAGQGVTFTDSLVQTLRPSRPSAQNVVGRRPWASVVLAAVAVLGMLVTASLTYRYLSAKALRAGGGQGGALSGAVPPEATPDRNTPMPLTGEPVLNGRSDTAETPPSPPPVAAVASPATTAAPATSEGAGASTQQGRVVPPRSAVSGRPSLKAPRSKAPGPPPGDTYETRGD
jgi:eukaryotic-like serine/threonine-protein kinase